MATYNPGSYQPPQAPPGTRPDYGRPRAYSGAPPTQPDPNLLGPQQQPYPSPGFRPTDPYAPNDGYESYAHHALHPDHERARRHSHSSHHSKHSSSHGRHSHDSPRRSHESKRSHHSRHFDDDVPIDGHRRSHESRRSHRSHHFDADAPAHGEPKRRHGRKSGRKPDERPTLGGSLFSLYDLFKSALGPRDKV